jgi:hypothetical protein
MTIISAGVDTDTANIAKQFEDIKEEPTVRSLRIITVCFDETLAHNFADLVLKQGKQGLVNRRAWKKLFLIGCEGDTHLVIQNAIETFETLEVWAPNESGIGDKDEICNIVRDSLPKSTTLKSLKFRKVMGARPLVTSIAQGLRSPSSTSLLEELDLSGSRIGDRDRADPTLSPTVQELSHTLRTSMPRLRILNLFDCGLGELDTDAVVRALEQSGTPLQELYLGYNICNPRNVAGLLGPNSSLVKLDYQFQHYANGSRMTWAIAFPFVEPLRRNNTLTYLDLSGNLLSDGQLASLGTVIGDNTTLEKLILHRKPQFAVAHPYGIRGLEALLAACTVNTTLHTIQMPPCRQDLEILQRRVVLAVNLNKGRIVLHNTSMTLAQWPVCLESVNRIGGSVKKRPLSGPSNFRVEQVSLLYFLLRQGPPVFLRTAING